MSKLFEQKPLEQQFDFLYKEDEFGCKYIDECELTEEYKQDCASLTEFYKDPEYYDHSPDYEMLLLNKMQLYLDYMAYSSEMEEARLQEWMDNQPEDVPYEVGDEEEYLENLRQAYVEDEYYN